MLKLLVSAVTVSLCFMGVVTSGDDDMSFISDMENLQQREQEFNQKLEEHLADIDSQLEMLNWFLDTYYKVKYK